jgi:hypothetical protein
LRDLYDEIYLKPTSRIMAKAAALKSRGLNAEDDSVTEFLGFILNHDPNSRPTIDQVIERLPNRPVSLVKAEVKANDVKVNGGHFNDDQINGARGLSVTSFLLVVFLVL